MKNMITVNIDTLVMRDEAGKYIGRLFEDRLGYRFLRRTPKKQPRTSTCVFPTIRAAAEAAYPDVTVIQVQEL